MARVMEVINKAQTLIGKLDDMYRTAYDNATTAEEVLEVNDWYEMRKRSINKAYANDLIKALKEAQK